MDQFVKVPGDNPMNSALDVSRVIEGKDTVADLYQVRDVTEGGEIRAWYMRDIRDRAHALRSPLGEE